MTRNAIEVRELRTEEAIHQAACLLYQVYVVGMGWELKITDPDNRSGIIYVDQGNEKTFLDKYFQVSTWYGVYSREKLIGCVRTCGRLSETLEVELYTNELPKYICQETDVQELNRFATTTESDEIRVYLYLLRYIIKDALENDYPIYSTTGIHDVSIFKKLGWMVTGKKFQYKKDPNSKWIDIVYTTNDIGQKLEILKQCNDWINEIEKG